MLDLGPLTYYLTPYLLQKDYETYKKMEGARANIFRTFEISRLWFCEALKSGHLKLSYFEMLEL